jgi:hypothetical protein
MDRLQLYMIANRAGALRLYLLDTMRVEPVQPYLREEIEKAEHAIEDLVEAINTAIELHKSRPE